MKENKNSPFYELCFPERKFRLKKEAEKFFIYDELRKKWIICTPEEWVRQNLLKYLVSELKFPQNLIAVEKSLSIAGRTYRFDALVYDRNINPLVIVECKSPVVPLDQKVFDQIWNYNYEISAPFFIVTNGLSFLMGKCSVETGVKFFDETVEYDILMTL
ncbi:MAG: type I restriction enzyme HsdR N-terminal domain-containing protein [Bacteroidales bacterium]|jgi:hypothetical protein|nr:type I restriction enzyme HsdR N-terminal domain-containing protein [Bacteroidales bacterium]